MVATNHGDKITNWKGYFFNMVGKEAGKARDRNKHGKNVSLDTAGSGDDDETGNWTSSIQSDREPGPLTNLLNNELRQTIKSFIEKLSCLVASVVRLRLFEEKKFEEIADQLQCPLGTVHARFKRGLGQLRKMLEESGYIDLR